MAIATGLGQRVNGTQGRCKLSDEITHDRFVDTCYLGDRGNDTEVIETGLALDCPR